MIRDVICCPPREIVIFFSVLFFFPKVLPSEVLSWKPLHDARPQCTNLPHSSTSGRKISGFSLRLLPKTQTSVFLCSLSLLMYLWISATRARKRAVLLIHCSNVTLIRAKALIRLIADIMLHSWFL